MIPPHIYFLSILVIFCHIELSFSSINNNFPIIGIFAHPSTSGIFPCNHDCQYIAASYVKYIESAGARVVPIPYDADNSMIDYFLQNLNGFFFPGGNSVIPPGAQYLYDRVVELNAAGKYTPLWGTCLGFEWLLCAASHNNSILDSGFDSMNLSIPIYFTRHGYQSQMFAHASKSVMESLSNLNIAFNNHHQGITVYDFLRSKSLSSSFDILSLNKDRRDMSFVSAIESPRYPIYGVMWHPEKNLF
eukprot:gene9701-20163_t